VDRQRPLEAVSDLVEAVLRQLQKSESLQRLGGKQKVARRLRQRQALLQQGPRLFGIVPYRAQSQLQERDGAAARPFALTRFFQSFREQSERVHLLLLLRVVFPLSRGHPHIEERFGAAAPVVQTPEERQALLPKGHGFIELMQQVGQSCL